MFRITRGERHPIAPDFHPGQALPPSYSAIGRPGPNPGSSETTHRMQGFCEPARNGVFVDGGPTQPASPSGIASERRTDLPESRTRRRHETTFASLHSLNPPRPAGFRHQPPGSQKIHRTGRVRNVPHTQPCVFRRVQSGTLRGGPRKPGSQTKSGKGADLVGNGRDWFTANTG